MKLNTNYKTRYVAFIDILGFKDAVYNSHQNTDKFREITLALENLSIIKDIVSTTSHSLNTSKIPSEVVWGAWQDIKITTFSDSILISAADNHVGLMALGAYCCLIYHALFSNGFFARGAITKGELFESQDIVFGKALIDAYELESKTSIYPRILISDVVLVDLQNDPNFYKEKDFDGAFYIDVFYQGLTDSIETWRQKSKLALDLQKGKELLLAQYMTAKTPNIKAKLYWLIQYFNSRSINHGLTPIDLPQ